MVNEILIAEAQIDTFDRVTALANNLFKLSKKSRTADKLEKQLELLQSYIKTIEDNHKLIVKFASPPPPDYGERHLQILELTKKCFAFFKKFAPEISEGLEEAAEWLDDDEESLKDPNPKDPLPPQEQELVDPTNPESANTIQSENEEETDGATYVDPRKTQTSGTRPKMNHMFPQKKVTPEMEAMQKQM